jgi:hypothetical protein
MTKPIPDKAEVALEYPDKLYMGTFERSAQFDAHLDEAGVSLTLYRPGSADVRKSVHVHLHHALFADVLRELAKTAAAIPADDGAHREALCVAAGALYCSLGGKVAKSKTSGAADNGEKEEGCGLTPKEEVLLLHVLE